MTKTGAKPPGVRKLEIFDCSDELAHGLDFGARSKHGDVGEEVRPRAYQRIVFKLVLKRPAERPPSSVRQRHN